MQIAQLDHARNQSFGTAHNEKDRESAYTFKLNTGTPIHCGDIHEASRAFAIPLLNAVGRQIPHGIQYDL